jgi:hypothetical protein
LQQSWQPNQNSLQTLITRRTLHFHSTKPHPRRNNYMSIFDTITQSVGGSLISGVTEKLGLDASASQGIVDALHLGQPASADTPAADDQGIDAQSTDAPDDQDQNADAVEAAPNEQGFLGKAVSMLDQDGDGNLMNEAKSVLGGLFNR